MAKFTVGAGIQLAINQLPVADLIDGSVAVQSRSTVKLVYEPGSATTFRGSFTYQGGELKGGVLRSIKEVKDGALVLSLTGLNVSAPQFPDWAEVSRTGKAPKSMLAVTAPLAPNLTTSFAALAATVPSSAKVAPTGAWATRVTKAGGSSAISRVQSVLRAP